MQYLRSPTKKENVLVFRSSAQSLIHVDIVLTFNLENQQNISLERGAHIFAHDYTA